MMSQSPVAIFFKPVPTHFANEEVHRRKLAEKLNDINNAKFNCALEVTLVANAVSTTIQDQRITGSSLFSFMPVTAHAAAALGGLYVPEATIIPAIGTTPGSAVIQHANDANTDKSFRVGIFG